MSERDKDQKRPCIRCGQVNAESSLILLRQQLGEQFLKLVDTTGSNTYSAWVHRRCWRDYSLSVQRLEFLDLQASLKEESTHPTEIVRVYEAANAAEGKYKVGDRVVHAKFGSGIVAGVEGKILTVTFDTGKKRIMDDFVKRQ